MLDFRASHRESPEIPRTGELRERGEIRRLCVRGARDAADGRARWVYEDDPVRVRIKGYRRTFEGIARQLEPGSFTLETADLSFPLTIEQVEEVEEIPTPVALQRPDAHAETPAGSQATDAAGSAPQG